MKREQILMIAVGAALLLIGAKAAAVDALYSRMTACTVGMLALVLSGRETWVGDE